MSKLSDLAKKKIDEAKNNEDEINENDNDFYANEGHYPDFQTPEKEYTFIDLERNFEKERKKDKPDPAVFKALRKKEKEMMKRSHYSVK